MVISPTSNSFKTAGVEYALTYFDNPGIVMPAAVTSWVAQKQMPEFLNKMHLATIKYAEMRRNREQYEQKTVGETSNVCQIRAQSPSALTDLNVVQFFRRKKVMSFKTRATNIHQSRNYVFITINSVKMSTTMKTMMTTMIMMKRLIIIIIITITIAVITILTVITQIVVSMIRKTTVGTQLVNSTEMARPAKVKTDALQPPTRRSKCPCQQQKPQVIHHNGKITRQKRKRVIKHSFDQIVAAKWQQQYHY